MGCCRRFWTGFLGGELLRLEERRSYEKVHNLGLARLELRLNCEAGFLQLLMKVHRQAFLCGGGSCWRLGAAAVGDARGPASMVVFVGPCRRTITGGGHPPMESSLESGGMPAEHACF